IVFDQDAAGPGGTDMLSLLILLQAPDVQVLGVTVVTGDAWRDEEVQHALRLLELVGRSDIPVVPGAAFPLVRSQKWTEQWESLYGKVDYKGAWNPRGHGPYEIPSMPEGNPSTKAANEDAAYFLIRTVHEHPHEITIYEGGPMTNLALALAIDPHFAELAQGLVFMGGSIDPKSDDPEFATNPRREFNLWFDPEAAHIVLRARWAFITCTSVDVSLETKFSDAMFEQIAKVQTPAAQYIARFSKPDHSYMWDELAAAAFIDSSYITNIKKFYMDVNLDRGANYGDTIAWGDREKPADFEMQPVNVQLDVDMKKFGDFFVKLMTSPTPGARNPLMLKSPAEGGPPAH
ncbi:MAG TPA: nucleoside hydrolase, partial [Candidatus Acidoferrales bacterium]|nr:nucleoside hydrolase [Candidatus Acidoferrales bacterium]